MELGCSHCSHFSTSSCGVCSGVTSEKNVRMPGESCISACAALSSSCNANATAALNVSVISPVVERLGVTCDEVSETAFSFAPFYDSRGNDPSACRTSDKQSALCSSAPSSTSDVRRICFCGDPSLAVFHGWTLGGAGRAMTENCNFGRIL